MGLAIFIISGPWIFLQVLFECHVNIEQEDHCHGMAGVFTGTHTHPPSSLTVSVNVQLVFFQLFGILAPWTYQ